MYLLSRFLLFFVFFLNEDRTDCSRWSRVSRRSLVNWLFWGLFQKIIKITFFVFFVFGGARIVIRFGNIGPQRLLGSPTTSSTVAVHTYVNDGNAEKPGCPRRLWWGFLHTLYWWYFANFGWRISHGDDIWLLRAGRLSILTTWGDVTEPLGPIFMAALFFPSTEREGKSKTDDAYLFISCAWWKQHIGQS